MRSMCHCRCRYRRHRRRACWRDDKSRIASARDSRAACRDSFRMPLATVRHSNPVACCHGSSRSCTSASFLRGAPGRPTLRAPRDNRCRCSRVTDASCGPPSSADCHGTCRTLSALFCDTTSTTARSPFPRSLDHGSSDRSPSRNRAPQFRPCGSSRIPPDARLALRSPYKRVAHAPRHNRRAAL